MAVFEVRRIFIAFPVQGDQNGFIQFGAFFEHRLGGFQTRVFERRHLCNLL